jgi:Serine/threonine protein phosphatase
VNGTITASARSDVGAVRSVNEDSFVAREPAFLVADGMGGHARGDKASQEAVRVVGERIAPGAVVTSDAVLEAIDAANRAVRALSSEDETGVSVAGTTISGVVQVAAGEGEGLRWMIVNVGDSRVYGWDGRTLAQLSVDHSAVQELVDAGEIEPEEAAVHPERNIITRALGASDDVDVDVWLLPVGGRQSFLICSDGLNKELTDEGIAHILARSGAGSATVADELVDAALAAGGRDNITVIVIESLSGVPLGGTDATVDRSDAARAFFEDTTPRAGEHERVAR